MKTVVFAPAALARLSDIVAYTLERFGEAQAETYAARLEALASGKGPKAQPCERLMRDVREASGLVSYHEPADGSLRILMIHKGLLTLPPWPIPHSTTFESRDVLSRPLRKSRRTGRAGLRLPGPADSRHATAPRPFFATSVRSFNDAPRGRFSPRSH